MTEGFAAEPGLDRGTGGEGVQRYRKRPVVIEAVRWTGSNSGQVAELAGDAWPGNVAPNPPGDDLIIDTLEGEMRCQPGDWLIKGVAGEFYPCREDIFAATYEPVADGQPDEPPLPEGIYGRIEIPGMRSDTGWITEGTRGGQTVLVVADWNGCPLGEYILGPACRLVHLPTPLKRPDPQEQAAITSGAGGSDDYLWERE